MKQKYLILFSLSGLVLCLDQLTKFLVHSRIPLNQKSELIPGFIDLVHAQNNGFAFGLLQKAPSALQNIFFVAVPVFALILIILIFIKLRDDQMMSSVALTSILGGAIGNLIDRLQYGYVIDFLKIHWKGTLSIGAFNVADLSIIAGVLLMFINTLKQEKHPHKPLTAA